MMNRMATNADRFKAAQDHHQAGRFQEARQSYLAVLADDKNQPVAWFLLGLVECQTGGLDAGISCFLNAVGLSPDFGEAHRVLADIYLNRGCFHDAIAHYRRTLAINPNIAEANFNLGNALLQHGNGGEAIEWFRHALELKADYPDALNNLGNALRAAGRLDEAVAVFRRQVVLAPHLAEAHSNLGIALHDLGEFDEAIHCYQAALRLKPDYAVAYNNWGTSAKSLGNLDQAIECYRHAIALAPDIAAAHNNLGTVYEEQGKLDEAVNCYRAALELQPKFSDAFNNLGNAFRHQKKLDDALACYRRAIDCNPANAEALCNLGTLFKDQAKLDEAIACYRQAIALRPDCATMHSGLLYTLIFSPKHDAAALYAEHQRWNERFALPLAKATQQHSNDRTPDRRLRIGYLSGDFREHVQAFFTLPLFRSHNRQQFEIICYSNVACPDAITERQRSTVDGWQSIVGISDENAAALIRKDQIDILVDLSMHMAGGRPLIFARKPAPVQACWFAYPGTTGISAIDYRLIDPYLTPPPPGRTTCAIPRKRSDWRIRSGVTIPCLSTPKSIPCPRCVTATSHLEA
jgi:protein O-GlcNAc transferase